MTVLLLAKKIFILVVKNIFVIHCINFFYNIILVIFQQQANFIIAHGYMNNTSVVQTAYDTCTGCLCFG